MKTNPYPTLFSRLAPLGAFFCSTPVFGHSSENPKRKMDKPVHGENRIPVAPPRRTVSRDRIRKRIDAANTSETPSPS